MPLLADSALRGGVLENLYTRHGSLVFHLYASSVLRRVPLVEPRAEPAPLFVDVPQDGTKSERQIVEYTLSAPRERIVELTQKALGPQFSEVELRILATDAGNHVHVEAAP